MEEMHRARYVRKGYRASIFSELLTLPELHIFTNLEAL